MNKHTLFALYSYLEIEGRDRFKTWLIRQGYTNEQIEAIRAEMKKIKNGGSVDYGQVFETNPLKVGVSNQ